MKLADPRLLRSAGAARNYLIVTVGLGLAGAALILVQAGLAARVLATAGRGATAVAMAPILAGLAVALAGRAAAAYGGEVAALRAAAAVKSRLRRGMAAHALALGPGWLAAEQAGEITTLATRGLDGLDAYFSRYLPQLLLAVVVPVAVLARVGYADWISGVIIAVTLPLIPLFAVLVGLHTKAQTQRQWRLLARLGGHFLDVVAGLPTLKIFGRAKAQTEVIAEATGAYRAAAMTTLRVAFLSALVLELAAALATALVAVEVGLRLLTGHLPYQTALLILLLTPEAYVPLRGAAAQFHAAAEGATAAEHAFGILATPRPAPAHGTDAATAAAGTAPGRRAPEVSGTADLRCDAITLSAVSLAYPGRCEPAIEDITLTIRPGEQIILTGPSGAGKSSLLALLLRFAVPTSGTITAGTASLDTVPADNWRQQIAWLPQRPYLFTGTPADNIALGQPGANRGAIIRAAVLAGAHDFIGQLPRGYDTRLGEGARQLSAGQRQQIALARAFLRDAPLLLLDEPAAYLDAAAALALTVVLRTLAAGQARTIILITHRPPPDLAGCRVLTLDRGRLRVADGGGRTQAGQAGQAALAGAP